MVGDSADGVNVGAATREYAYFVARRDVNERLRGAFLTKPAARLRPAAGKSQRGRRWLRCHVRTQKRRSIRRWGHRSRDRRSAGSRCKQRGSDSKKSKCRAHEHLSPGLRYAWGCNFNKRMAPARVSMSIERGPPPLIM